MTALVINSKRNGLPVIRSLGSRNINVIAADHFQDAIGFYSRYANERVLLPLVTDGEEQFVRSVAAVGAARRDGGREAEKIVLVPASDAHLLAFTRHWPLLEEHFLPLFETDLAVLELCLDKTKVVSLAENVGVPIPKTLVSPPPDRCTAGLSFPVVIKPDIRSGSAAIAAGLFRLRVCHSDEEAAAAAGELAGKGFGFVVQEFIPGGDDQLYTVGALSWGGQTQALFTGRKLRQFPPRCGECSYGEIVRAPKMVEYARKLLSAAGLSGVSQVEFKRHGDEFYLIEINPRVWSWVELSAYAGVDLPWIGYQALRTGNRDFVEQQRFTGKWSYLGQDLKVDKNRDEPVGFWTILRQSARANSHSIWRRDDPLPGLIQTARDLGLPTPLPAAAAKPPR